MCAILISKVLRLARVDEGSHSFTYPHTFIHIWNKSSCLVVSCDHDAVWDVDWDGTK